MKGPQMWRLMCILVPFVLLNAIYSVQSVEARHRTTKEVKRSTTISSVTNGNARTVNSSRAEQSSPSPLVSAQDEKMSPTDYYSKTVSSSTTKCKCGCGREDCGCGREPGSAINQSSTQPLLPERQVYYATTPKYHTTDVSGATVRQHLIQWHGYTREQLKNKSQEELRTLHDQAHAG